MDKQLVQLEQAQDQLLAFTVEWFDRTPTDEQLAVWNEIVRLIKHGSPLESKIGRMAQIGMNATAIAANKR